jgi:hypothetical protein
MAPRRAFGPWLHRTCRADGGCGPRDGPADAPEAALCGRAHDVAVAAPNAALMLVPNDRRYPVAVKVKKRRLFSFVDYMTDRHTVFLLVYLPLRFFVIKRIVQQQTPYGIIWVWVW